MRKERFTVEGIPALLWGEPSRHLYVYVHGKMSSKETAEGFARLAGERGMQTLSFDLPGHGERTDNANPDFFHGMRDLNTVADYAFGRWEHLSLYACSLGAYFSLQAFGERPFERALFQSPIVDMEFLVKRMMEWFGVTEEELKAKGIIDTPLETMRWEEYRYILTHPTERWTIPTAILFGGRDNLQSREVMDGFSRRFGARLTVSPCSEHPFMGEGDGQIVEKWLKESM